MSKKTSSSGRGTQVACLCRRLMSGRSIGQTDQINAARGWRLSPIVFRLRAQHGWPIKTDCGDESRIARYRLVLGADRKKLKLAKSVASLTLIQHKVCGDE